MAKGSWSINVTGLDELTQVFEKASKEAEKIASKALYNGAGIVADSLSQAIDGIQTEPFKYAKGGKKRKPSPEEKAILKNARHGVAKFKKNGMNVNTSVGFQGSGYAELNGKTVPVELIANSINHGTSFMSKQPFIRKAKQSEHKAVAEIEKEITEEAEKILNG